MSVQRLLLDDFLRTLILRFMFMAVAMSLHPTMSESDSFAPTCSPKLPRTVLLHPAMIKGAALPLCVLFGLPKIITIAMQV